MVDQAPNAMLSFIAIAEFQQGLFGSTRHDAGQSILNGLIQILPILLADGQTIRIYAEIGQVQKKRGRPIPANDLWIAASPASTICPSPQKTVTSTTSPASAASAGRWPATIKIPHPMSGRGGHRVISTPGG